MVRKKPPPSDLADKFLVRLPDGMRSKISQLAKENNRSMNSQIVNLLNKTLSEHFEEKYRYEVMDQIAAQEEQELAFEQSQNLAQRKKQYEQAGSARASITKTVFILENISELELKRLTDEFEKTFE
jgi:hypothetical protein